jgi:hypothetical protein
MAKSLPSTGTALTLPLVLLIVSLLQDITTYKVRQHVHDVRLRTAILVVLYGVAFAIAANWLSPFIKRLIVKIRQSSKRGGGALGVWLFFGAAYALIYYAYLVVEKSGGPGSLLPAAWR